MSFCAAKKSGIGKGRGRDIMMKVVNVITPAKINLTLQVFHKRADGFHELETVMQAVDFRDAVKVSVQTIGSRQQAAAGNEIQVRCAPKKFNVPEDEANLCYKAAAMFLKEAEIKGCNVHIFIRKNIPPQAGLGGGSGNAAGCLVALNHAFSSSLSRKQLLKLAKQLGSDVPYFLHGGLALCKGKGEKVFPLSDVLHSYVLLVFPDFTLSTKDVYYHLCAERKNKGRCSKTTARGSYSDALIDSLRKKSIIRKGIPLRNDLEKSTLKAMGKITAIKKKLFEQNAIAAAMSGSGSCVYGLFTTKKDARRARKYFNEHSRYETRVTLTVSYGVRRTG